MNGTARPYMELLSEFNESLKRPGEIKEHPPGLPEIGRIVYDFCAGHRRICVRMNVPVDEDILKALAGNEKYVYAQRQERPGTPETIMIKRPRARWLGKTILETQPHVNREGPLLMIPPGSAELAADYLSKYLELFRTKEAPRHDQPLQTSP